MNIEEKTKMAHEYFRDVMAFIRKEDINHELDLIIKESWQYADAMEAEAEKRIKAKAEQDAKDAKVFFEKLTKSEDGSCKHFHTTLNHGECFDCGENLNSADSSQLEFQVDWSVAPEWADWWAVGSLTGQGIWSKTKPVCVNINGVNYWDVGSLLGEEYMSIAPSFNYRGDWKDSLRKRPK